MKKNSIRYILTSLLIVMPILLSAQVRLIDPRNPCEILYALSIPDSLSKQDVESMKLELLSSDNISELVTIDDNLSASNYHWHETYYTSAERLIYLLFLKEKTGEGHKCSLGELNHTIHYVLLEAMAEVHDSIEMTDIMLSMHYLKQSADLEYGSACRDIAKLLYHGSAKYNVGHKKYIRIRCTPDEKKAFKYLRKAAGDKEDEYQKLLTELQEAEKKAIIERIPEYHIPAGLF